MTEWIRKNLGEITSFITKGIPPKYAEKENQDTVRVLNQKCNRNFEISYEESRIHNAAIKKIPEDKYLRYGDVLINSTGMGTAGRVAQIFNVVEPTTIDGHMILIRPTNEIDSLYYGYAIKGYQKKIESLAEGSTGQTEINRRRLQEEIMIFFPREKALQKAIGTFLFQIDEKIRNNKQINNKFTDVFMASDLWNNYSFMIWGSLVYFHTKSFAFALICMLVQLLYILLFSEAFAKRFSTFYNYPQCCMTAPHHLEGLPFAVIMNWILGKIGFDKIKINATTLQKKLGIFGEPMFIGLVVGALIGFLGNINDLTTVAGWGSIITAAVSTAAIMAVFPRVAGIFAGAFTIITDAYKSKAAEKGKDRDWYLSVNDAVAYGEPNTLAAGILSIPIILILSFVLPGNIILPMADLVALPYMSEVFCATSNGNIAKTVAMNVIWFSLGMIIVSQFCPAMTQIAIEQGVNLADYNAAGVSIVSFGVLCHPFIVGLFAAFWFQNYIAIAIIIVVYVVLYVLFKKNRYTFVDWMENQAAKYQL